MAASIRKGAFRGTAKKGKEKRYDCQVCGDRKGNLEINQITGKFNCWVCGFSGRIPGLGGAGNTGDAGHSYRRPAPGLPLLESEPLPEKARLYIEHRGFNAEWLTREYGLRFRDGRIAWPTGGGWALRSINEWDVPKVLFEGPGPSEGALIGAERLARNAGCPVVVTEGDFKAASIPLPFVGVGIGGSTLHPSQLDRIMAHTPEVVVVFADSNIDIQVPKGCPALRVSAANGGPDDDPLQERIRKLLQR